MSRKTRPRRPRKVRPAVVAVVEKPINYDRLRQIYTNMTCRRQVVLSVVPLGIEVEASSPEEMIEKTDAVITEITRKLPEN